MVYLLGIHGTTSNFSSNTNLPKGNQEIKLKVGVYENSPKIYTNTQGEVRGFFPDILTYIASREGWEIEYIPGSWSEGLSRLKNNSIDLFPDVGYSSERAENYDFNNLSVLTSWALIYTREDSEIKSMDQLQNKKIAVMKDDIDYIGPDGIKIISEKYNLNCSFVEYSSLIEVLESIEHEEVDAGVINELFGNLNAYNYHVIKTAIVFNPVEFKFGFPKNASLNADLIEKIDYWLEKLKLDPKSYYYETYQLYFSEIPHLEGTIPPWIMPFGLGSGGAIVLFLSISVLLRHQVRVKTKKLFDSEQRFRSLVESTSDWIWEVDQTGKYTFVSPKVEELLGYRPEEVIGKTPFDFMPINEVDQQRKIFEENVQSKNPFRNVENINIHRNGSKVILESSGEPIFNQNDVLIGYRGIDRDITKFKEIQERLMHAQKMEAIGRFAGGIAHDFNNLLTVINGFSNLMLTTLSTEDQEMKENLEEINKAGNKAASLTKKLLAFSRKQIFQPKVIEVNKLIQNMEIMLKRLLSEDISFQIKYSENLAHVFVDPSQIEQVIMNLVVNSRDAMPKGGTLLIETSNVFLSSKDAQIEIQPGNYIQILIADTGTGMKKEQLLHLFEPYYTTKEQGKGTGLGLSTVFGIVKQSQGEIKVSSQLGKGTTIKVYLPQKNLPIKKDNLQPKQYSPEALKGTETILVVEDEESIRNFIIEVLRSHGYTVLFAENPQKALDISQNYHKKIHLLLTDVIMPIMSGMELKNKIVNEIPDLTVLFMSGYTDKAIVTQGILKDGLEFLPKPFLATDLLLKIKDLLSTTGSESIKQDRSNSSSR